MKVSNNQRYLNALAIHQKDGNYLLKVQLEAKRASQRFTDVSIERDYSKPYVKYDNKSNNSSISPTRIFEAKTSRLSNKDPSLDVIQKTQF